MERSRIIIAIILLLLTIVFAGCSQAGSSPSPSPTKVGAATGVPAATPVPSSVSTTKAGPPIKIGMVAAMSGPNAVFGVDEAAATGLAVDYINETRGPIGGRALQLIVEDSKSDPATALTKFKKLTLDDKIDVFIQDDSSSSAMAVANEADAAKIPVWYVNGTASLRPYLQKAGGYAFRVIRESADSAPPQVDALQTMKMKSVAIAYEDTEFGKSQLAMLRDLLKSKPDIRLVAEVSYANDGQDFTPQARQFGTANPEAVLVEAGNAAGAIFTKNLRQIGYTGKIIMSDATLLSLDQYGSLVDGTLTSVIGILPSETLKDISNPSPQLAEALTYFEKKGKAKLASAWLNLACWDQVMIIDKALRAVGPEPQKLRDYTETMKMQGILANYEYTPHYRHGFRSGGEFLLELKQGKWQRYQP